MARLTKYDHFTLRDKIHEASLRAHELAEHLRLSFVPKVHGLRKVSRAQNLDLDLPPVEDLSIRHQAAAVLEANQYTDGLSEHTEILLEAISTAISKLASTGIPH